MVQLDSHLHACIRKPDFARGHSAAERMKVNFAAGRCALVKQRQNKILPAVASTAAGTAARMTMVVAAVGMVVVAAGTAATEEKKKLGLQTAARVAWVVVVKAVQNYYLPLTRWRAVESLEKMTPVLAVQKLLHSW